MGVIGVLERGDQGTQTYIYMYESVRGKSKIYGRWGNMMNHSVRDDIVQWEQKGGWCGQGVMRDQDA